MSTEFTANGNLTLRRTRECLAVLQEMREEFDDVRIEEEPLDDDRTADVWINIFGTSHSHSEKFEEFCKRLKPFVIGAGAFDCENEGDKWRVYVGRDRAKAKQKSADALGAIELELPKLSKSDRAKLFAILGK